MRLSDSDAQQNYELYKLTAESALQRINSATKLTEGQISIYNMQTIITASEVIDFLLEVRSVLIGD